VNFLQRLFSQPKVEPVPANEHEQVDSGERDLPHSQQLNDVIQPNHLAPGLHIGKLSDVGRERERNEDSFYVIQSVMQSDLREEALGLFIVADGMGGHQKGEVASSLAARVSAGTILKEVYLPYLAGDQNANNRPLNEVLVEAVRNANSLVQKLTPGGGTTLTIALVMGNNAYLAHVGDTRGYIFKQGQLKQITQDHSLAQKLVETGQVTPEEVAQVQNVLYKAVGQSDLVEGDVDTYVQHLPPGASLLLCSDGLWGLVTEEKIKEVLAAAATPQQACEQLVALANENGGRDNITAIIATMGFES
jgi:serine/threonine protein phosphatase PrpC